MYVLWRVIVKEFLQLRQDKRMIPLIFGAPILAPLLFSNLAVLAAVGLWDVLERGEGGRSLPKLGSAAGASHRV